MNLGSAGDFVILAKSGISTTGTTIITGDIGVSPIDHTGLTGFSETMDSTNQYSISSYVVGKLYAADYTDPTPAKMTTAVSDMETAYTDAAGRTLPNATELGAGDISAMTIVPGLYKWGTGVHIDDRGVTLSGGADDVWIFQIDQDLTVDSGAIVTLTGGALASNVFWQVGGGTGVTLGTTCIFNGNILAIKAIVMNTGAVLNGRALAQTAVTLDANTVSTPTNGTPVPHVPVSTVKPIGHYWTSTGPQTINATGSGNSMSIELFYRFAADNATWGAWALFGNDTAFPWSWSFTFPSGNGHYELYTVADDGAGDVEAAPGAADARLGYDNVAPTSAAVIAGAYWHNATVTITANALDAVSGLASVELFYRHGAVNGTFGNWTSAGVDTASPWSWSFAFASGQGFYEFHTLATDRAGNVEAAPSVADALAGYDTVAPTSACSAVGAYWRNAAATITATASDATSGVASVELFYRYGAVNGTFGAWTSAGVDATSPWSWSFAFASGQGYYEFHTRAIDMVGIVEAATTAAQARLGFDTTKPVIVPDPTPDAVTASKTMTFNITIPDNVGIVSVQVSLDNVTFINAAGPSNWMADLTLANGGNTIYIRATDAAGNVAYSTRHFYVDDIAPTLTIGSPANGTIVAASNVAISGTATDNKAIAKVELSTNGGTTWTVANGTTAWHLNVTLADGAHTILVRTVDTAGNVRTGQLSLSVDTQAPNVLFNSPATDVKVTKDKLTVNGTSSDNVRVTSIRMTLNGVAVTVTGLNVWSANVTLKQGKNIINVTATDSAGLTSTVKSITVTYNKPKSPGFEGTTLLAAVAIAGLLLVARRKRN